MGLTGCFETQQFNMLCDLVFNKQFVAKLNSVC